MKIFIAGHQGMVGNALFRFAKQKQHTILTQTRKELDLTNREQVFAFFQQTQPEWVFLAAAKVGGIIANSTYPVEFLLDNLKIQNNIIEASSQFNVQKLLFLGSSCIYPKFAPQPIQENSLLTSPLEVTNEAYAIAKITGIKLCKAYNQQYGKNFICVMPSNLYGLNDNYHPQNGHALPMLLRRFHEAKINQLDQVVVWGTGQPKREFLFSDDLAEACFFLMENYSASQLDELINIGTGVDLTIKELAYTIQKIVGFQGDLVFDPSKPDGTPRKVMDVTKINTLGWKAKTSLEEGLRLTYEDFCTNNVRK